MTSKEIAEMIQRAKEAEALFDDLRDDERPVYSTLQKVGSALDELIQFAERPVYEPVKTEDLTPGWYWAVSQSGVVTVCEAMGHSLFFIRKESMIFSEYSVKTILDRGYTLYRIPELEVSE